MLQFILRDIYRNLFQCELSGLEAFLPPNSNVSDVFMWSHSRALCSPPACPLTPRSDLSDQLQCFQKCDARGLNGLKSACHTYSHVVLKEVRFFDLDFLDPLFQDPNLDLRIIHLIRDPRAVMRSREQAAGALWYDTTIVTDQRRIPPADFQYEAIKEICRSHVLINERASLKPPSFLIGRYKMVRYEDLVRNPIGVINDLYEFVGLDITRKLAEWVYRVTHGKGTGSKADAFKITSRDANDVSEAWRSTMPFSKVKRIQEVCYGAMKLIGYRTVSSEKEMKNFDVGLLVPQEPYKFVWLPAKTLPPTKNGTKHE